jgi:hypothetical protein
MSRRLRAVSDNRHKGREADFRCRCEQISRKSESRHWDRLSRDRKWRKPPHGNSCLFWFFFQVEHSNNVFEFNITSITTAWQNPTDFDEFCVAMRKCKKGDLGCRRTTWAIDELGTHIIQNLARARARINPFRISNELVGTLENQVKHCVMLRCELYISKTQSKRLCVFARPRGNYTIPHRLLEYSIASDSDGGLQPP